MAAGPGARVKVVRLDTIRVGEYPNLLFVEISTDEGFVGLGETFLGSQAVSAYLHESVAPVLLGQDPTRLEHWNSQLVGYLGTDGPSVETRGSSAVDIALWDILGQLTGQPLYALLGGRSRDHVRIYNTCAGPRYIRERPEQSVANWGLSKSQPERYDDLRRSLERPGELAMELLSEGITAMKIWPFDIAAEAHEGAYITAAELDRALHPLRAIRAAVKNDMDVMLEFHSLWRLPAAQQIARAVEEFDPFWLEDPVRMSDADAVVALTRSTPLTIAGGEAVASRRQFRELLNRGFLGVLILDVAWTGGLTEARKIAALADSYAVPVAPHDCTGPVVLTASTHLSVSMPNAIVQETVRASYRGWYQDLVTDLPPIKGGVIRPTETPGLGTQLQPDLRSRSDTVVISSQLENGNIVRHELAGSEVRG